MSSDENIKNEANVDKRYKEKGNFGYIHYYKKKQGIIGFISLAMVLIIFFTGVIIYHTNKSIFTVIAAVSVLPAAKYLIALFVVLPYKTGSKELYEKLAPYTTSGRWIHVEEDALLNIEEGARFEGEKAKATLIADTIFTFDEHIMNVDFIVINRGHVFAFSDFKKLDYKYTEGYLKKILDNSANYKSFKLYDTETAFLNAVMASINEHTDDSAKVLTNDMIIARKLLPYSI